MPSEPDKNQLWVCPHCRCAGAQIRIRDTEARTRQPRYRDATILIPGHLRPDGACKIRWDDTQSEPELVQLDELQWHAVEGSDSHCTASAIVASAVELSDELLYDRPPKTAREALSPDNKLREFWAGAMKVHYEKLFKKKVFVVIVEIDALVYAGCTGQFILWTYLNQFSDLCWTFRHIRSKKHPCSLPH